MRVARKTAKRVNLPSNLNSFGGFAGTKIKSIQFPESLKIIHQNTLDKTKISEIRLPNKLEVIGVLAKPPKTSN
ncbi:leucine-rich repeat protein, partial [Mycoplasmopsis bovis]|uniref:leucine-rich repeat protein n=1 Tax=Mycoplasmopsis bovis TaxID=28903 RepID=UPI003D2BFDC6